MEGSKEVDLTFLFLYDCFYGEREIEREIELNGIGCNGFMDG